MSDPTFRERGLWFPTGIAVAFALMVLWNVVFVTFAVRSAQPVDPNYSQAIHR